MHVRGDQIIQGRNSIPNFAGKVLRADLVSHSGDLHEGGGWSGALTQPYLNPGQPLYSHQSGLDSGTVPHFLNC